MNLSQLLKPLLGSIAKVTLGVYPLKYFFRNFVVLWQKSMCKRY